MLDMGKTISPLARVLGSVFDTNALTYRNECLESSHKGTRFWDIVIVTACNHDQRIAYLQRIQRKLDQHEIPTSAEYLVIDDPPGTTISSGGSTIYVMHILKDKYKDRPDFLTTARILLIHAGGYSSRLPHVSACGKLFMAIPQNNLKGIQVFDIKLILYLHLLQTMPPGVFVTSADGIELFASKTPFPATTQPLTITALAHPSPLNIATTHGVFELAPEALREQELGDMGLDAQQQNASLHKCLRFHHKPSMDHLQRTPGLTFKDPNSHGQALAYTDSCYYFDPSTATVLANIYPDLPPHCNLEAWADILDFQDKQLSADSSLSFSSSTNGDVDHHLLGRQLVQQALQAAGVELSLLVLNASRFYHLGTMTEFLDAVCLDQDFMAALRIEHRIPGVGLVLEDDQIRQKEEEKGQDKNHHHSSNNGIHPPIFVQDSIVPALGVLPPWTMIIDIDLAVPKALHDHHRETISSSPLPIPTTAPPLPLPLHHLPAGLCMFSLQLASDAYVTFSFSTKDDMKKLARPNHSRHHHHLAPSSSTSSSSSSQEPTPWWDTLCVFETIPVARWLSPAFFTNDPTSPPHNHHHHRNRRPQDNYSLWDAPMFEIAPTKQASTFLALQRLARLLQTPSTATIPTTLTPLPLPSPQDAPLVTGWISLKDAAAKARTV